MLHNVADFLRHKAQRSPEQAAAIEMKTGKQMTYGEFDRNVDALVAKWQTEGIRKGDRVAVFIPLSIDFFITVFSIFRLGAVVVAIDPAMGIKNINACLLRAEPKAFVGITKAILAKTIFGWAPDAKGFRSPVTTVASTPAASEETAPSDAAAILFTSGSTGIPKGAVYTHGNFIAQIEAIRTGLGIQDGEVNMPTFPLFALFDPAFGMTSVLPDMDFSHPGKVNPLKIKAALDAHKPSVLFGSPALLRQTDMLDGARFDSLRCVVTAGAPVPTHLLESFSQHLHGTAKIFTPYGCTEALPISFIHHKQILGHTDALTRSGHGICVGSPAQHTQIKIAGDGEILVSGPQVTQEYFQHPEMNAQHKVWDDMGQLWHKTGDVGKTDDEGQLWYLGRKSHRVTFVHLGKACTLDSYQVESRLNSTTVRTALVGVMWRGSTYPVIVFENHTRLPNLADCLFEGVQCYPMSYGKAFPVDVRHNAKINREQLTVWAASRFRP